MKIVFLDLGVLGINLDLSEISSLGDLVIFEKTHPFDTLSRIYDTEVIITSKVMITSDHIDKCPNLKIICVAATGTNNVDVGYAISKNIKVYNVENYATDSVAQVTYSLILRLISNIDLFEEYVHNGLYANSKIPSCLNYDFPELAGKTIGIIGMGNIGKKIALIAESFSMNVIYHSPSKLAKKGKYNSIALGELVCTADVISINCLLNDSTFNLINKNHFERMKQESIIINTSRGGIINEYDLVCALKKDLIGGAALDVFSDEPLPINHPLLSIDKRKLVLTPHIGWSSNEAKKKLIAGIAKNISTHFKS